MSTIQGNLASVGKDLETAQKRAEKVKSGKSATKVANATADVNAANQQWESQAPYVFERLQALDENRVNHLRDVLTQLQTHELDHLEKSRVAAETCLNTLLNVDTTQEISTFVARSSGIRPRSAARQHSRTATNNTLSPPPPARPQDDGASEMSSISAGAPRSVPSPGQLDSHLEQCRLTIKQFKNSDVHHLEDLSGLELLWVDDVKIQSPWIVHRRPKSGRVGLLIHLEEGQVRRTCRQSHRRKLLS